MAARNSPNPTIRERLEALLKQVEQVLDNLEKQVNKLVKELESGT